MKVLQDVFTNCITYKLLLNAASNEARVVPESSNRRTGTSDNGAKMTKNLVFEVILPKFLQLGTKYFRRKDRFPLVL